MSMIGNFLMVSSADAAYLLENPATIEAFLYEKEHPTDRYLDIEKTWHVIHFLFTNTADEAPPPEGAIILGGLPIGDEDVGYGPARILNSEEVVSVADLLENMPAPLLIKKFDLSAINKAEIYPTHWTGDSEEFEYITENYQALRDFYKLAASRKMHVVQYLN